MNKPLLRVLSGGCLLLALVLAFSGCAMKPGGNDSSTSPTTVLITDTSNQYADLFSNPVIYPNTSLASGVAFSHKAHVKDAGQPCSECHPDPFSMLTGTTASVKVAIKASTRVASLTMEAMYEGKNCGKCHNGSKAFAAKTNCDKCHSNLTADPHTNINVSSTSPTACVACHAGVVQEFTTIASSVVEGVSSTGHGHPFIAGHGTTAACGECHHHEAVTLGKTSAMANAASNHEITCQTCHFPTDDTNGTKYGNRLRKEPTALCATCHHTRYVYSPEFPTLPVPTGSNVTAFPIDLMYYAYKGDAKQISDNANAAKIKAGLTNFTKSYLTPATTSADKKIHGGNYPHYSTQYDLVMGSESKVTFEFSKDLDGKDLTPYTDTPHKTFPGICVKCHMHGAPAAKTYGHTFKVNDESCKSCHTGAFDDEKYEEEIEGLLKALAVYVDADKNGTVTWARNTEDQDLVIAMNNASIGDDVKTMLLGAAWNYHFITWDGSKGMHNYTYAKTLLENTITVMKQLKAKNLIPW